MNEVLKHKSVIAIHCQYVYGIGHFIRTIELAKELTSHFEVYLFNGGEPIPNFILPKEISLIQLPAIYKDEESSILIPLNTSETIEECFKKRMIIIKTRIHEIKPDIVITEHFPFGLLFKDEVLFLINEAKKLKKNSKIVCSVRDIIESRYGSKSDLQIVDLLNERYDMVLVHGDQKYIPLIDSFPLVEKIQIPVYHTGYIVRKIAQSVHQNNKSKVILTSIAGGRLGYELLDAIIDCYSYIGNHSKYKFILFSGAFQVDFEKQQEKVDQYNSKNIELKRFNTKVYLDYLSSAHLVISLGGYNTVIESISANKKMLIYKRDFKQDNEEQDLRISKFDKLGWLEIISPQELAPEKLSQKVLKTLENQIDNSNVLNIDGAKKAKVLLVKLICKSH